MILPTIQIPISLDVFGFHLKNFIQDYQLYMSDEIIPGKTEKKKDVWASYEILFRDECNTVNNSPGAIFGQIESIVLNSTLIEMRAAVIRMEEVPVASDFFSKFYKMVVEKWDVIHDNIFLSNEFNDYFYLEEVNPKVDTGWNGQGNAVVYAYEKLVRQSGIDSKYLPYFPFENLVQSGNLILYEPIEGPDHQQHDDLEFLERYFEFKDELNHALSPITEFNDTALANQTKSGKKGPSDRIKKLANQFREIKLKNPSLSRVDVAKKLTKVYRDEIEDELREKQSKMRYDEIDEKVTEEFRKKTGKSMKEFTADNVRYCYEVMDYDWKPAKKGK